MASIYGHKWTSSYGDVSSPDGGLSDTAEVWSTGLAGVSAEQFARGLEVCVKSGEAWPPTLPEFREMCLGKQVNEFGLDYVPECYRKPPERSRDRLLSSDDRDARRKSFSSRMSYLSASLKKTYGKPHETEAKSTTDSKPFTSDPEYRAKAEAELKNIMNSKDESPDGDR